MVLVDGRAIGVWEYAREGNALRVKVSAFGTISPGILARIEAEGRDLSRFLGTPSGDIQIVLD